MLNLMNKLEMRDSERYELIHVHGRSTYELAIKYRDNKDGSIRLCTVNLNGELLHKHKSPQDLVETIDEGPRPLTTNEVLSLQEEHDLLSSKHKALTASFDAQKAELEDARDTNEKLQGVIYNLNKFRIELEELKPKHEALNAACDKLEATLARKKEHQNEYVAANKTLDLKYQELLNETKSLRDEAQDLHLQIESQEETEKSLHQIIEECNENNKEQVGLIKLLSFELQTFKDLAYRLNQ